MTHSGYRKHMAGRLKVDYSIGQETRHGERQIEPQPVSLGESGRVSPLEKAMNELEAVVEARARYKMLPDAENADREAARLALQRQLARLAVIEAAGLKPTEADALRLEHCPTGECFWEGGCVFPCQTCVEQTPTHCLTEERTHNGTATR